MAPPAPRTTARASKTAHARSSTAAAGGARPARRRQGIGFPAPVIVRRPAPRVLVVAESRGRALVRLVIWFTVVGGFALSIPPGGADEAGARWLLLLVPLALLPYLVDGLRVLLRRRETVFDGARGEVRVSGRDPIGFGALRRIELRAVNGTCEEAAISVRLADGASLPLATGHRIEAMLALAREAADLAGVPLHTGGDVAGARET